MELVLAAHIGAGAAAVLASFAALVAAKGRGLHRAAGRVFFWAMAVVCVSAVLLAALRGNVFLLLIGLFSVYLAFAGWRFAVNRSGAPAPVDWAAVGVMALSGLGMGALSLRYALAGEAQWVTLAVFGGIALALAAADAIGFRRGALRGAARIRRHLTNMTGAAISALTAVLVVNVETQPVWLAWIAPTLALTPLIVWWNVKLARGERRPAAPGA